MLSPLAFMENPCTNLGCLSYRDVNYSWPHCLIHSKLWLAGWLASWLAGWLDGWMDGWMNGRDRN